MKRQQLEDYINQDYSISEICAATGRSNGSVTYWLKKHDLKTKHKRGDGSGNALWRERGARPRKHSPCKMRGKKDIGRQLNTVDWTLVQTIYDSGLNYVQTADKAQISVSVLRRGVRDGLLKARTNSETFKMYRKTNPAARLSEEARRKISESRKAYMKANPDWHWRNPNRFNSVPCEKFKTFLRDHKIDLTEEHQPLRHKDRYYCIDIAFPAIKLGIEINGSQHYGPNSTLKEYYQTRHDLIVAEGWELIEIHYTKSFDKEYRNEMLKYIQHRLSGSSTPQ